MKSEKFKRVVISFIFQVPKGQVVSYGQVATVCGKPQGAREVGRILHNIDISKNPIPWWRVVNNRGEISIKGNWTASKERQAGLLADDGLKVSKDYKIDIEKYRFQKIR